MVGNLKIFSELLLEKTHIVSEHMDWRAYLSHERWSSNKLFEEIYIIKNNCN